MVDARFRPKLTLIQTNTSLTAPTLPCDAVHACVAGLDSPADNNRNGNNIMGLSRSPSEAVADGVATEIGFAQDEIAPIGNFAAAADENRSNFPCPTTEIFPR